MPILAALMGFLLLSGAVSALPAHADAPMLPTYEVTLTAYNAVSAQTDDDPLVTASGAYSNPEVVAARSHDLNDELPFGTIIEITGPAVPNNSCGYDTVEPIVGYRVIADTMSTRYTKRIDILFHTKSNYITANGSVKNAGDILGICNGASIKVVGHIDLTHPNRLPKTQKELATILATL